MVGQGTRAVLIFAVIVVAAGCSSSGSTGSGVHSNRALASTSTDHRTVPRSLPSTTRRQSGRSGLRLCSPTQLRLGHRFAAAVDGPTFWDVVVLHQRLRNTGPDCKLALPRGHLTFTGPTGAGATTSIQVLGRPAYRVPHGAIRTMRIGVAWPTFERPSRTCPRPLMHPTMVSVPMDSASLQVSVQGLWPPRGIWPEVCRGPAPRPGAFLVRVPTVGLLRSGRSLFSLDGGLDPPGERVGVLDGGLEREPDDELAEPVTLEPC